MLHECNIFFNDLFQTCRTEGVMALYKGFIPTFLRLGPWNTLVSFQYDVRTIIFMIVVFLITKKILSVQGAIPEVRYFKIYINWLSSGLFLFVLYDTPFAFYQPLIIITKCKLYFVSIASPTPFYLSCLLTKVLFTWLLTLLRN